MAQALQSLSRVRLASLRKIFLNLAKACSIGAVGRENSKLGSGGFDRGFDGDAFVNNAELARERHLGLGHARTLGQFHRPTLESCRALERSGQNRVGGLIERRAHRGVADLADPAAVIRLPDWYFLGVRPKCGPTCLDDLNLAGSSIAAT